MGHFRVNKINNKQEVIHKFNAVFQTKLETKRAIDSTSEMIKK